MGCWDEAVRWDAIMFQDIVHFDMASIVKVGPGGHSIFVSGAAGGRHSVAVVANRRWRSAITDGVVDKRRVMKVELRFAPASSM